MKRQEATGGILPVAWIPPFPGLRGRPTRSSLRQAERDNPDEVRRRAVARCW